MWTILMTAFAGPADEPADRRADARQGLQVASVAARGQIERCALEGCARDEAGEAAWVLAVHRYLEDGVADGVLAATVRVLDQALFDDLPAVVQASATEPSPWALRVGGDASQPGGIASMRVRWQQVQRPTGTALPPWNPVSPPGPVPVRLPPGELPGSTDGDGAAADHARALHAIAGDRAARDRVLAVGSAGAPLAALRLVATLGDEPPHDLDASARDVWLWLAALGAWTDDPARARGLLDRMADRTAFGARPALLHGDLAASEQQFLTATRSFREAYEAGAPEVSDRALLGLVRVYRDLDRPDRVVAFTEDRPLSAEIAAERGVALLELGDATGARWAIRPDRKKTPRGEAAWVALNVPGYCGRARSSLQGLEQEHLAWVERVAGWRDELPADLVASGDPAMMRPWTGDAVVGWLHERRQLLAAGDPFSEARHEAERAIAHAMLAGGERAIADHARALAAARESFAACGP